MTDIAEQPTVAVLRRCIDRREIAAAALRVRLRGRTVADAALGLADIEQGLPVTPTSIFRLASLTKPIISAAVLQLVEQGAIELDDPVARHIPAVATTTVVDYGAPDQFAPVTDRRDAKAQPIRESFATARIVPAHRAVTVRDLLTHSSGLGQGRYSLPLIDAVCRADQSLAERVEAYAAVPGDFQPGAETGYSPLVGFDTLGRIVEVVSGSDLESYLQAHIFEPLRMCDSSFVLEAEQLKRLVKLYEFTGRDLRDVTLTDALVQAVAVSNGRYSGAAGLYSTLDDYDRFAQMLANSGELDGVQLSANPLSDCSSMSAPQEPASSRRVSNGALAS